MTSSSRSGVSSTQVLGALSDGERREMCDWVAQSYGGYGAKGTPVQCAKDFKVTPKAPKSQDSCVADLAEIPSSCKATIAEAEDCFLYFQSNPCSTEKNPTACATLYTESCTGKSTSTTVTVVEADGGSGSSGSPPPAPQK